MMNYSVLLHVLGTASIQHVLGAFLKTVGQQLHAREMGHG